MEITANAVLETRSAQTQLVVHTRIRNKGEGQHMPAITGTTADPSARQPAIGTLRLQLKPAHTESAHAYDAVTTAAGVNDVSTCGAGDPLLSPVALQRWESDGGAQPPTRSQAQMQDV